HIFFIAGHCPAKIYFKKIFGRQYPAKLFLPDNVWQKLKKISAGQCPAKFFCQTMSSKNFFLLDNIQQNFFARHCSAENKKKTSARQCPVKL
ncbi:MAG: hypothetical protein MJE68_27675, partial [Proteobacteria bacterium]|nr:hypothetical protein [Pseudomonadota bacterium]